MSEKTHELLRVRVLVNRRSGVMWSFDRVQSAIDDYWDTKAHDLSYQFCKSAEDGLIKAKRAVEDGIDILLVAGGDGTISTTGSALIGSDTVLGAIPLGSGNGFARHFGISLKPTEAALDLATAEIKSIDVGCVNGKPFLATCSMAWDAAIVRSFQKSPVRGILPYVFAGVYEFFDYTPQRLKVILDDDETFSMSQPLLFTIANLTQYGADVRISPETEPDDGKLELVAARKQDVAALLSGMVNLPKKSLAEFSKMIYRQFRNLKVVRDKPAMIQIDGELVEAPEVVEVEVKPKCLKVLVPRQID